MDINQQYDLIKLNLIKQGLSSEEVNSLIESSVIPYLMAENPGLFLALPPRFWLDRLLKQGYFRSEVSEVVLTK